MLTYITTMFHRITGVHSLKTEIQSLNEKLSALEEKTTSDILDYDFKEVKRAVLDDIDVDSITDSIDWGNVCYQHDIITSGDFESHFDDALSNAMDTIKDEVESNLEIPEAKVENLDEIVSKAVQAEIAKLKFVVSVETK